MAVRTSDAAPPRDRDTRGIDRMAGALAWGALIALAVWAAAPVIYLLIEASAHHESLSGGDSLFAADQLQYLAWTRGSGEHVLASNGFALRLRLPLPVFASSWQEEHFSRSYWELVQTARASIVRPEMRPKRAWMIGRSTWRLLIHNEIPAIATVYFAPPAGTRLTSLRAIVLRPAI